MVYLTNKKRVLMAITQNWKNKVTIEEIHNKINEMLPLYQDFVDSISAYEAAIEADYTLPNGNNKSKVRPKVIKTLHSYSYNELSESLLSSYDVVKATARGGEDRETSLAHTLLLNYQINEEMDFIPTVERSAKYFEDYGSFMLRATWNFKERKTKEHKQTLKQLPSTITPEQVQQLQQQGLLTPDGLLIVDTPITEVVEDHPVVVCLKPNQVILGNSTDGSNSIESLEFIACKYYSTVNRLKSTKKYENLDKLSSLDIVSGNEDSNTEDDNFESEGYAYHNDSDGIDGFSSEEKEDLTGNELLVVTEYWTKLLIDGEMQTVIITFVGGTIIARDLSPFGNAVGYPFARGVYSYTTKNKLYDGEPDTLDLEENQKIIGAVTRGMIDILAKTANGQVGMAHGFLDPAEELKKEAGDSYKFNPALDPAKAITVEKFPELPRSGLDMLMLMQNSMESSSGKKMFGEGLNSTSYGEVAAGIKASVNATTQRLVSRVRRFQKPYVEIFKKISEINREFITEDKMITLSDGAYKQLSKDSLEASVNIKIEVSTPELDDKTANDLAFMIQTLGDTVTSEIKNMMLADVARLKKRPILAKMLEELPPPQPSQMEVEKHQLEVELLKAQIANEYAKAKENDTDSTLNLAKAETEAAKIGVLGSTKDKQDLEFLEKRQGIDINKKMQLEAQKHSNSLESAAMNAMLTPQQGDTRRGLNKVPNDKKTSYADIPIIDLPKESLQPSDLRR